MKCLEQICPSNLVIIITIISYLICHNKEAAELDVIGNAVVALGGLILIWSSQQDYLDSKKAE